MTVKEKAMQVKLTFKAEERYIYDEIQKHSGKANWVKDVLAEYIRKGKEKTPSDDRAQ